jgi:nucleoside-diphosphate-sugar epimerase
MVPLNVLIIGGSGFVSGTLAKRALAAGHAVWTVTRGERSLPDGVTPLIVDRQDREHFASVIAATGVTWDLVVDCIGFTPADAEQDVEVFRERAKHLVFVSTDFVYEPSARQFPQAEEGLFQTGSYGGNKRRCELVFINSDCGDMAWTVVRPCHIYGPGSLLGCLPLHGRDPELIAKLQAGETLELVGGGHFLQQPILARDLADLILSAAGNERSYDQIFCAAGPDIVESVEYYRIIADVLGVELSVNELSVADYLAANPGAANFLCHRIYDMSKLVDAGLWAPSTSLQEGLAEHVASLM